MSAWVTGLIGGKKAQLEVTAVVGGCLTSETSLAGSRLLKRIRLSDGESLFFDQGLADLQ